MINMDDKEINANAAGHKRHLEERIAAAYRRMDKTYIEKERRERIAVAAMQGLLSDNHYKNEAFLAEEALRYADALIAALEGGDERHD